MLWQFWGNAICYNYPLSKRSDLICYSLFYPQMEMLICPDIFYGNFRFFPLFVRVYKIAGICPGPIKLGEINLRNTVRNLCENFFYPIHILGDSNCQTTFIISSSIQTQGLQHPETFFFLFKNKARKLVVR